MGDAKPMIAEGIFRIAVKVVIKHRSLVSIQESHVCKVQEGANALAIYLSVIFSLERAGGLPAVFINFAGLHRNPSSVDQKR
jgi:hypothetical protein